MPARRSLRLAPSLLSADFGALGEAIAQAEAGGADAFHLDVMDGHFVPNISFGPAVVRAVRSRTKKPLDVHLMIQYPQKYLSAFHDAGGDTLVFHVEAEGDARETVKEAHALGVQVGAALRPDTPVDRVMPLLAQLDQVQIMSVYPGFSGQSFRPEVLPKTVEIRRHLDELGTGADLSMDGGLTVETARSCAAAGTTFFVCGNSVYSEGTVADNLARLRESVVDGALHEVR